jgi:phosphoribosylglycinamide formyltransferase-1/phosphoribosylamine--glycine ligase/phosphoribosylglycinamide formyltransferase/phosphoribosylformylglycinamidine cyclo-ligase
MIKKRVAVLISGRGSNMESLIAACADPDFPAEIVGVISNKADAKGLETAAATGIATFAIPHKDYESRSSHDAAVHETLLKLAPDFVALAGYMRILTPEFVAKWEGKMINIHPSLLPKYKGTHTHERALEAGDKEHGCTVHFVTAELDDGPIIAQAKVPVLAGDTPETLSARVLIEEHKLYPKALNILCLGKKTNQDKAFTQTLLS